MAKTRLIPVLVTTAHRGVFFGWIDPKDREKKIIYVAKIRNAIYWSGTGGFLSLASDGPASGSKIGKEAVGATLHDVTSIVDCNDAAVAKWGAS